MAMKIKTAHTGQPALQHLLITYALANRSGVRTVKRKAVGTKALGRVDKVKRTTIPKRRAAKKATTSSRPRATRVSRR
jgi:hypothetical protein